MDGGVDVSRAVARSLLPGLTMSVMRNCLAEFGGGSQADNADADPLLDCLFDGFVNVAGVARSEAAHDNDDFAGGVGGDGAERDAG